MKMIKSIFQFIALLFLTIIFFSSCKKPNNATPATPYGQFWLHLHTNINQATVDSGAPANQNGWKDANGRMEYLTYAEFYISNITIYKADGTPYHFPTNLVILKFIDNEDYYIDSVPAGNYTSVSFNVGIPSSVNNVATPSNQPASSPLSGLNLEFQYLNMWFGSTNKGYTFLNVQGMADTSENHTGTVNFPFSYQIGGNSMLNYISLPQQQFTILPQKITYVHLICDYGNLLQGINFVHNATPFNADSSVAKKVSNRISTHFLNYETP